MALLAGLLDVVERRIRALNTSSIPAWIETPGLPPLECKIQNYSIDGAKVALSDRAVLLPGRFAIRLSNTPGTGIDCEVRWRRGSLLGVKFLPRTENPSTSPPNETL